MQVAFKVDEDGFAGRHIALELEADAFQRHRFRGNHVFDAAIRRFLAAQRERADAERITHGQHAVARDLGSNSV